MPPAKVLCWKGHTLHMRDDPFGLDLGMRCQGVLSDNMPTKGLQRSCFTALTCMGMDLLKSKPKGLAKKRTSCVRKHRSTTWCLDVFGSFALVVLFGSSKVKLKPPSSPLS